jgi:lipopolysaccharide biosynthesis glycosyltransferase
MKVFVGYDTREDITYQVCEYSILKHCPDAQVIPLIQKDLRDAGLYTRPLDNLGSTEFTFTRFLVPFLSNYQGLSVFVDCDFVFTESVGKLFEEADPECAVMVAKHEYIPKESLKMDGKRQLPYPRKNWSSMIVWNCGHPANRQLDLKTVNEETGQYLHRFQWLKDDEIGKLSHEWNWLVNWYNEPEDGSPKALHYTEGGPWFKDYRHCEYSEVWKNYLKEMLEQ